MRRLQAWWDEVVLSSQYSPPQVVEATMLLLAMLLCIVWWIRLDWQYLVLSVSYMVGAIASILARESVTPSAQTLHNSVHRYTVIGRPAIRVWPADYAARQLRGCRSGVLHLLHVAIRVAQG